MKKFLSALLVLTLVFGACSLTACELLDGVLASLGYTKTTVATTPTVPDEPEFSKDLAFELNADGESYTLVGIGACTDVDIYVPNEYEGKPVTAIGDDAFSENKIIKSITIPKGVLDIGDCAFEKCKNLESVELPAGLKSLGGSVFSYCSSLKSIVIPTSVTEIPDYAFAYCASLENIELHENITRFGMNCFSACVSLKELYIPSSIAMENFTEFYLFLNSLTAFDVSEDNPDLFDRDGNLYLRINAAPGYEFTCLISYAMGNPAEEFTVPSDVDIIYPAAFNFLPWDIDVAENMDEPDFSNCQYQSNLKKVTISDGVQGIMMMAFMFCTELETVVIPQSVEAIDVGAFMYCPNLKTVKYDGTIEEWRAIEKDSSWFMECPIEEIICIDGVAAPYEEPEPKEVITIWVSPTTGMVDLTEQQIEAFLQLYPEYSKYEIQVQPVSEGDAATEVLKDLATAPDIYCFAQDQLLRLVSAGALDSLNDYSTVESVINDNDAGAIGASAFGGVQYAYPITSDNGYFLYYDSSVISDEEVKTLEGIIEACKRSGKKFGFNLSNAWIMSSFFFARSVESGEPLCVSNWVFSDDGRYPTQVNDTFNSENGLIAMKAMNMLAQSGVWTDTADNFYNTGAVVTGIWNAYTAQAEYGDYMKAVKLPTFTVDEKTYQLGSYSGYKLMGVKPQDDPERSAFLHKLAYYLSGEECQLERYEELGWGPSNKNVQANEDVQSNESLAALLEQNVYSQPQGTIPSDWWTYAAELGITASTQSTDDAFRAALEKYENIINQMLTSN